MITSYAQDNSGNFTIRISGGSLIPGELNTSLIISTDSSSNCSRFNPSLPTAEIGTRHQFKLTDAQKDKIRAAIITNDFFSLDSTYINPETRDGFYIDITVSNKTKSHTVSVQNYHQQNIENIIHTINECIPPECRFRW
jgi:hypothetical protein